MSCLFVFTSSCLWENACLVCSSLPPVVCGRKHVLFVRLYLQLFVGGSMSCVFVFTSSCLWEEACLVCSSLPPVVCGRKHVLFVRLYLQLFVGGSMSCWCYLCLFTYYGVQHILCCVFVFLRLMCPMLPVSLDCPFRLPLRYSLTFIQQQKWK